MDWFQWVVFFASVAAVADAGGEIGESARADAIEGGRTNMDDGFFTAVNLFGAMVNGPSNSGARKDGLICTAQAGECRYNSSYYSLGMRGQKSWARPHADDRCPEQCCYLRSEARDMGSSQGRQERVGSMVAERLESEGEIKMKNYQEWLDSLIYADERGGKYLCPLCGHGTSLYGRKRLLGCDSGSCASWSLFKAHEKMVEKNPSPRAESLSKLLEETTECADVRP